MRFAQRRPAKLPYILVGWSPPCLIVGRRRRWDRGCGGQGAPPLSPVDVASVKTRSCGEQIDNGHWLVACRTQSTHTDALAEGSTVTAVLFAEVAGLAGSALVDRAMPRSTCWDRRKWSRVSATPRRLAAGRLIKALSANRLELGPADGAPRRLAVVTQREFSVHGHCCPAAGYRAVQRPCRPSPGPI